MKQLEGENQFELDSETCHHIDALIQRRLTTATSRLEFLRQAMGLLFIAFDDISVGRRPFLRIQNEAFMMAPMPAKLNATLDLDQRLNELLAKPSPYRSWRSQVLLTMMERAILDKPEKYVTTDELRICAQKLDFPMEHFDDELDYLKRTHRWYSKGGPGTHAILKS